MWIFLLMKKWLGAIKVRKKQSSGNQEEKTLSADEINLKAWHENMRAIKPLKTYLRKHRVPCYLVAGLSASGKSSLINSFPCKFLMDYHENEEPKFVRVWCADEAVFFELQHAALEDQKIRRKTLRKLRSFADFQGVMMCLAADQLSMLRNTALSSPSRLLRQMLLDVQRTFHWHYPLRCFLTKSDKIMGFSEYMETLPENERHLGFDNASAAPGFAYEGKSMDAAMVEMVSAIQQYFPQQISFITDIKTRQRLCGFVGELGAIKIGVQDVLAILLGYNKLEGGIPFAGLEFVSTHQGGEHVPFQSQQYEESFALQYVNEAKPVIAHEVAKRSATFRSLFKGANNILAFPTRFRRYVRKCLRVSAILAAIFIVMMTLLNGFSYISLLHAQSEQARALLVDLPNQSNEQQLISMVNLLNNVEDDSGALASNVMLNQHQHLLRLLLPSFDRVAQQQLLPALMQQVERFLKKDRELALYQDLKIYLMMGEPSHRGDSTLQHWFATHVKLQGFDQQTQDNLLNWLFVSPFPGMKLNHTVINNARVSLRQLPLADLVYLSLKDQALSQAHSRVAMSNLIGVGYCQLFSLRAADGTMPALFTRAGVDHIYPNLQQAFLNRDVNKNWVMGQVAIRRNVSDINGIKVKMNQLYVKDYIDYWQQVLNQLPFKTWRNVATAQQNLLLLSQSDSPLQQLLLIAQDNTQLTGGFLGRLFHSQKSNTISADIGHAFTALTGKTASTSYDLLYKDIVALSTAMQAVPAGNVAGMLAVTKNVLAGKFAAIVKLEKDANTLPAPFNIWAQQIVKNSINAIFSETVQNVQAAWQDDVVDSHQALLSLYPLNKNSKNDMSVEMFAQLLGKRGLITQFAQSNIQPLLEMGGLQPQAKHFLGVYIPLSKKLIGIAVAANMVSQHWFNQAGQLSIHYHVVPVQLSDQLQNFTLQYGQQLFVYRHGPSTVQNLSWTPADAVTVLNASVSTLSGRTYSKEYTGIWALLRFIDQATRMQADDAGMVNVQYAIHGFKMHYQTLVPALGGLDLYVLHLI